MEQIALMGLGVMGSGMANCLLNAGYSLTVYNRTSGRAAPLVQAGARSTAFPCEAAEAASVVISMVADDDASRAIWQGGNGALQGCRPGSVLIESSTLSPAWIRELAIAADQRSCAFLDAPVTGSKLEASTGELLFLAGGDAETVERVTPILKAMGRGVVHAGPAGSGTLLKLMNNFLCAVQTASLAEGLALLEKAGVNSEKSVNVLINGAGGSPMVKRMASRILAQDYLPHFKLGLMEKDLRYVLALAESKQVSLETAVAAHKLFHSAVEKGWGDSDLSAVVEPLRS